MNVIKGITNHLYIILKEKTPSFLSTIRNFLFRKKLKNYYSPSKNMFNSMLGPHTPFNTTYYSS